MMTPQQKLAEAMEKLHAFQTGQLVVELEFDGRKVRYNRTNIDELRAYIGELQDQVAGCSPRYGAVGFVF